MATEAIILTLSDLLVEEVQTLMAKYAPTKETSPISGTEAVQLY
jgi:hypothetical protein